MEDVKHTLNTHIENFTPAEPNQTGEFTELSKRWASHSLETYNGELLTRALAVSKSLAEFDAELISGAR